MLQKINGVELFVESYGQGEPVILVHGLTADHHSMENIGEWLKDDYQVILYDCRGHGQSEKPAHYTLMDHAQDLLGIMDFYGFPLEPHTFYPVHFLSADLGAYGLRTSVLLSLGSKTHGCPRSRITGRCPLPLL